MTPANTADRSRPDPGLKSTMDAFIHIGFHRTGTTALQHDFYPRLPDCVYLTHGGRLGRSIFRFLADNLQHSSDQEFLEETIRTYFKEIMSGPQSTLLVSHEGISGDLFKGAYNRERNADRLHAVLPQARILIFVRNQAGIIRSVYAQHIRRGGYASFAEFISNTSSDCDFSLDHLCYDTLVDRYQSLFGSSRVVVLTYETLVAEPASALAQLLSYLRPGHEPQASDLTMRTVHKSLSPLSRRIVRHTNRLFFQTSLNPKPVLFPLPGAGRLAGWLQKVVDPLLLPDADNHLMPDDEQLLNDLLPRYEESNARLERLTRLPLGSLGYPLPSART